MLYLFIYLHLFFSFTLIQITHNRRDVGEVEREKIFFMGGNICLARGVYARRDAPDYHFLFM